jgi:hypothetical protein
MSLDEYVAAALTERVNAPADTARYFAARAARAQAGRARQILARIGAASEPIGDDRL